MANADAPFGLKPVAYRNGAPYNGAATKCFIPSTDSNAMYVGDVVIEAGSSDTLGEYKTVSLATPGDGNYIGGVIVGFAPNPDNLSLQYRAASTSRYVLVADDPDLLFVAQEDGDALAATDVGRNVSLTSATAGSTYTGRSGWEIDTDTASTEASAQCVIHGLDPAPDNVLGANARWLIRINLHQGRNTTGV